jgi:uncharacterized membrane protein HdeD (DUF308 family)
MCTQAAEGRTPLLLHRRRATLASRNSGDPMTTQAAPTSPAAGADRDGEAWYLGLVSGVTSIAIGALVLAYPAPSVRLLGVFLGIDLVIAAGVLIVRGARALSPDGAGQNELLLGILALIAGVVVIRNPERSLTLLALALGLYLIVAGALTLGRGVASPERRVVSLVKGAVLASAGTLIVAWPDIGRATLTILAGVVLCLVGAFDIGEAFVTRRQQRKQLRSSEP